MAFRPAVPTVKLPPPATPWPDPIPGIIPFGTVTLLAGAPGAGKTALLADWIRAWRNGLTIMGKPTQQPTAIYYVAADRQWKSHQQWFDLVGYSDIPRYSLADDESFDLSELLKPFNAMDLFHRCLDILNPIPGSMVCVDPVSPLFIAGDQNRARDVARTMLGMSREAQQRQISLFLTAHFAKQRQSADDQYTKPQDRISGSGAFSGFTDTQLYLVEPIPNVQPYHIFGWVPRHSRSEEWKLTRGDDGLFVPYDEMNEDTVASHVLDCLTETGETSFTDILDRALDLHGHSKATVKRALVRLLLQRRVVKVGRGRYQRTRVH